MPELSGDALVVAGGIHGAGLVHGLAGRVAIRRRHPAPSTCGAMGPARR